jgi:hypothetical protein
MKAITLTIEKSKDGMLWGRVNYQKNLIIDKAQDLEQLKKQFRKLLKEFHGINASAIVFNVVYDLTTLFEFRDFLNISAIAQRAGISPVLMRHYAAGVKFPSGERTKHIEKIIRELGKELIHTRLGTRQSQKTGRPSKSHA